jgi:superoxide reductase
MTEKGQIYRCEICGNVVSVLQEGDGDLVCCGENMKLLSAEEAKAYS